MLFSPDGCDPRLHGRYRALDDLQVLHREPRVRHLCGSGYGELDERVEEVEVGQRRQVESLSKAVVVARHPLQLFETTPRGVDPRPEGGLVCDAAPQEALALQSRPPAPGETRCGIGDRAEASLRERETG